MDEWVVCRSQFPAAAGAGTDRMDTAANIDKAMSGVFMANSLRTTGRIRYLGAREAVRTEVGGRTKLLRRDPWNRSLDSCVLLNWPG